ncbi:MAG: hypothetical protein BGO23_05330 [Solirubrobacterales bacterium 67-14]|nr:MAG: hypothetical protein BGO23_05330 [Solirubrobacterales bacterium 67-14]
MAATKSGEVLLGMLFGKRQSQAEIAFERAAQRISDRQKDGEEPHARSEDDYLATLEVMIRVAVNGLNDKKAALVGNLYAASVFDPTLKYTDDVIAYIDDLDSLTWRQICILAYLDDESRSEEQNLFAAAASEGTRRLNPECERALSQLGRVHELIGLKDSNGAVNNPSNTFGGGAITGSNFEKVALSGRGATLCRITEIRDVVTSEDLDRFVEENLW